MAERLVMSETEFRRIVGHITKLFASGRASSPETQKLLTAVLRDADDTRKFNVFIAQGNGYIKNGQTAQARRCYKQALLVSRSPYPLDRPAQLKDLFWAYFEAIFFTVDFEVAVRLARTLARKDFCGKPFILGVLGFSRLRRDWAREVAACEGLIVCATNPEALLEAILQKAIALCRGLQSAKAKALLEKVIEERPNWSVAYEWLGGLLLWESDKRAFALLERAYLQGGEDTRFIKDLFIARIIRGDYEIAQALLSKFDEDPVKVKALFENFLTNLRPPFFQTFSTHLHKFSEEYEARPKAPRKHQRFLANLLTVLGAVEDQLLQLKQYMLPLAQTYWGYEVQSELSYYECVRSFEENLSEEVEAFLSLYNDQKQRVDPQEFRSFVQHLTDCHQIVTMV